MHVKDNIYRYFPFASMIIINQYINPDQCIVSPLVLRQTYDRLWLSSLGIILFFKLTNIICVMHGSIETGLKLWDYLKPDKIRFSRYHGIMRESSCQGMTSPPSVTFKKCETPLVTSFSQIQVSIVKVRLFRGHNHLFLVEGDINWSTVKIGG